MASAIHCDRQVTGKICFRSQNSAYRESVERSHRPDSDYHDTVPLYYTCNQYCTTDLGFDERTHAYSWKSLKFTDARKRWEDEGESEVSDGYTKQRGPANFHLQTS